MPTTQGRKEGTRGAQFPGRQRWPESLFRLRSCSKVFKSGSGYGNFSNLKIWLLLRLWLPSIHPKFTIVFTYEMTMQTPVIVENEKWLRIRAQCFTNFWLRLRIRKKNAESCRVDAGTPDPWPPLPGPEWLRGGRKSQQYHKYFLQYSTFTSKNLRFDHGRTKPTSCPRHHLTSLCACNYFWIAQRQLFTVCSAGMQKELGKLAV